MSSHVLTRLAIPLVLTLLLPAAFGFHWPAPVCWALLGVMMLSWCTYSYWSMRWKEQFQQQFRQQFQQGNGKMVQEQEQLLGDLLQFVNNEINGSRSEIERARELIRQAVAGLGGSFESDGADRGPHRAG